MKKPLPEMQQLQDEIMRKIYAFREDNMQRQQFVFMNIDVAHHLIHYYAYTGFVSIGEDGQATVYGCRLIKCLNLKEDEIIIA